MKITFPKPEGYIGNSSRDILHRIKLYHGIDHVMKAHYHLSETETEFRVDFDPPKPKRR
jgi:hypothetical protein